MFTGFNLKTSRDFKNYFHEGKGLYDTTRQAVMKKLDEYVGKDGKINATKIQEDWFPTIDSDVFISHSHKDKDVAIGFAGWLSNRFGLRVFIDSCVWGYANDLLKQIDDKYCLKSDGKIYDYDKRNNSTSHVHMMLSTSLFKMIDKTECIIILNTQNSILSTITTEGIISNTQTDSPWIYSEIVSSELIRKKKLGEYRKEKGIEKRMEFNNTEYSLDILYDVDLSHLSELKDDDLDIWESTKFRGGHKLDYLYLIASTDFKIEYKKEKLRRMLNGI